jgi:hypothetical protein
MSRLGLDILHLIFYKFLKILSLIVMYLSISFAQAPKPLEFKSGSIHMQNEVGAALFTLEM